MSVPSPSSSDDRHDPSVVVRTVVAAVRDENVGLLAAGIAYYAFVSLVPLLLLALSVASLVGGERLAERVIFASDRLLTPEAQALVRETLTANAAAGGTTAASAVVLTWSSLKLFRALDKAFSEVYGTTDAGGLLEEIRDGLVVLAAIPLGVAAVAVAGGAVTALFGGVGLLVRAVSLVALVAALFPLYYVFPDETMSPRAALPGTVVAALGWTALGSFFGLYAAVAGDSVYGVLGGVLLVVTWLYVGALVVMVGAVMNATLTGSGGATGSATPVTPTADRQLQQWGASAVGTSMSGDGDGEEVEPTADPGSREPTAIDPENGPGDDEASGPGDRPAPDDDANPEEFDPDGRERPPETDAETAEEVAALRTDLERLREQLDETDERLAEKTVSRSDLEADLRRYVRARVRRGHARGWGPYLVLLYGTAMTLGAFFYLEGVWAVAAMLVVWLSTLGLYTLMVVVGAGLGLVGGLGKLKDVVGSLRR